VTVYSLPTNLVSFDCESCGALFAVPQGYYLRWKAYASTTNVIHCCCCGHKWYFSEKSEVDKVRDQLESEIARADNLVRQRDAKKRQLAAAKGRITKIKNRVGNGVCPCCNRTFANLARHMGTQHPNYNDAGGAK
tara:strand:+ start:41 stop:445 length:405 start_codon:yes stop_codon:yes gene_type:complete